MTMAVDNQQRLGAFGLDSMSYQNTPYFKDPWASSATPSGYGNFDSIAKQQAARGSNVSMPYSTIPVSAPSISAGTVMPSTYADHEVLNCPPDIMGTQRVASAASYDHNYSSASSPSAFSTTSAPYNSMGYTTAQNSSGYGLAQSSGNDRRLSQPSLGPGSLLGLVSQPRENYNDALDASRGMVAMSQNATPRNLYESRVGRGSTDYGFPSTHSSSSSVSSSSYNPSYYGSNEGSVTDYSSTAESVDSMPSRTLPRPSGLLSNMPPAPQTMMGQFSSKVSPSTQKKHKCKVCEKRFTRPSSLQTHVYSHTGEKPFVCEVPGCGRQFSVVSNLRRHRKVHKGENHSSPEE